MPNDALATLLNLKKVDPLLDEQYGANDPYASMIPESDIMDLQGAYGDQGAASGKPFFVPSRQSLQQSAGAKLRQMFAVKQADAQAKALPEQVQGEYGIRKAETEGRYGVQAAQAKAEAEAAKLNQSQAFTAGQNDLNRQSRGDLQTALQAEIARREAERLQTQRDIQSMPLRPKAVAPEGQGIIAWLRSLLGGGTPEAAPVEAAPAGPQRVGRFIINQ